MTISEANMVKKFHEKNGAIIERHHLQDSRLLKQLDSIIITPLPAGASRDTKRQTINYFFELLDCLSDENLKVLRGSGVSFLLEETDVWVELEYLIHAAHASNPKKAVGLRKALANIINYSHGIYATSKIVTTETLVGNEYRLQLHSDLIFNHGLFGTKLFQDLRDLTSSVYKHGGLSVTLAGSIKGFFDILPLLNNQQIKKLKEKGLHPLIINKVDWIDLEYTIYNVSDEKSALLRIKQLTNLINYSNGVYKQADLITTTKHEGVDTPVLYSAYHVSIEFFDALVDWKVKKLSNDVKEWTVRLSIIGALEAIEYIKSSDKYKEIFTDVNLLIFNENIDLSEDLKGNVVHFNHKTMIEVLTPLGIDYPNYRVPLKLQGGDVFLKNTYKYSRVIFNELADIATKHEFKGVSRTTVMHYFSDFDSIGLPLLKEILPDNEFNELCRLGLNYLDKEDINDRINERARLIGAKSLYRLGLSILKHHFNKDVFVIKDSPYTLYFSGISRNNEIKPMSLDVLGYLSEKAFYDFKVKHEEYMRNLDHLDMSEITYHSKLQNFIAGLKKVLPRLSSKQLEAIKDNGLLAFVDRKYNVGVTCLEIFQSLVKDKSENSTTIMHYRNSFRSIIGEFAGEVPDVYVISNSKDEKIKKISGNSNKYYTVEEVRELAFYIEKALRCKNTSLRDKIYFYYAKIQIKTGWNQQPLLDLSLNRLTKRVNPITNQENYDLVLIKNRRSYKPSQYDFDSSSVADRDLRSVVRDIIFVRDNLTSELRKKHSVENHLFIEPCEVNGVKRIDAGNLRRIPKLISDLGCKIHYNPRKIRKGGVNFIYKNIAKSVREYEELAAHNFQTFLKSYKTISKSEGEETLSRGIDIMANYFSGKEISQELNAIDDINELDNAQETPVGVCSSELDSDEVKRFNKLNAKIVDKDNKYCGDFLACIWCKYFKVVKDADHMWKLLSYKEYVISSMERAIVNNEDPENQREFVDILSKRVDDIISFIEASKPDIVNKARSLIETKGQHPDWEFAFPLSNIVGNSHE
ncbi:hypothetical protein AB4264_04010 [Vibrio sp. 10N.261.55.B8]|uniref:hypothetical protein n=1 Tax=Vibrio TaxID=662 RepID=UPI001CDCA752|nr:hypothetical protein [Vibrio vulnificus]MCA3988195.1 hypothetical protein [Vibrio vulnificus]